MPFSADGLWKWVKGSDVPRPESKTWVILQDPDLLSARDLPWELRYVLAIKPSRQARLADWMIQGHGFGYGAVRQVSDKAVKAVQRISDVTHEGLAEPWLEAFVHLGQPPVWEDSDRLEAKAQGINLDEELALLKKLRTEHCGLSFFAPAGQGSPPESQEMLDEINQDLASISTPRLYHLLRARLKGWSFPWFITLILASLVVGPLAWFLPWSIAFFLAASFPSAVLVVRELFLIRADGRPWSRKRTFWLVGVFLLACSAIYGAFMSERASQNLLAGWLFGIAAGMLPAYYAISYLNEVMEAMRRLGQRGRLPSDPQAGLWVLLTRQRSAAARTLGLLSGPFLLAAVAFAWPTAWRSGWWLVFWGACPIYLAELLAWIELRSTLWAYYATLRRLWRKAIVLSSDAW